MNSEKIWLRLMKIGRNIGCHQQSCRSFFYKNYQFPVCARCTGILIGEFFVAPIVLLLFGYNNVYLNIILLLVMIVDGVLQYFNLLKSSNIRRFVTGLGAGYALTSLIVYLILFIINIL